MAIATTAAIDTSANQNRQSMANSKKYKPVSPVAVFSIRQMSGNPKYLFSGMLTKSGLLSKNPEARPAKRLTKKIKTRSRHRDFRLVHPEPDFKRSPHKSFHDPSRTANTPNLVRGGLRFGDIVACCFAKSVLDSQA